MSLIILIANSRLSGVPPQQAFRNFEVQILPKWVFNQLLSFERSNIGKFKVVSAQQKLLQNQINECQKCYAYLGTQNFVVLQYITFGCFGITRI